MRLVHERPEAPERPVVPEPVDVDALIDEARRLRRRRWTIGLVAMLVAAGASSLGYALATSGGSPGGPARHFAGGSPARGASVVARWTDRGTGGALPAGAQVTSVVGFDGRLVAAGDYFGAGASLAGIGCSAGCNPVVWTSRGGSPWSVALARDATGSIAGSRLVATARGLLLFDTDEGTRLWLSAGGRSWHRVAIPPGMSALSISGVTIGHHRVVAILSSTFAGGPDRAYGDGDTIWSSTDGTTWHEDVVPDAPRFTSLATTSSGFVVAGTSRATGQPTLWRSSNGLTWSASAIPVPHGELRVAARGDHLVLCDAVGGSGASKAAVRLWWSTNGRSWTNAVVHGGPVSSPGLVGLSTSPLLATADGFLVAGGPPAVMWSSPTGQVWTPVVARGLPPRRYHVQELLADGAGLLAVASSTDPRSPGRPATTSIWQVSLVGTW